MEQQGERDRVAGELQSLNDILAEIATAPGDPEPGQPSVFRRLAGFPTFLQNQAVTELLSDLNRLETERTDMATRRTPNHPDMVALRRSIDQLEDQLHQLAINYGNSLGTQIAGADQRLAQFGGQLERIPQKALQQARLERQKEVLEQVFTLLQSRLKESEIAQAVEPGDVRIVDGAITPTRPIRPRKVRSMALAIFFGLIAGAAVAGAKDYLDETVHSREDLTRVTNLPVLAMIPHIKGARNGNGRFSRRQQPFDSRLVTRDDVGSPVSEAYRAFRTNITFLNIDEPLKVLVLTSPGPAEGKSTSVVNLAITLAQQNTKTLVVDCDLRRGIVHKIFGEEDALPGLTNVLLKENTLDEAIRTTNMGGEQGLFILPTGTLPPNPSELLGSKHMRGLLAELRHRSRGRDRPQRAAVCDGPAQSRERGRFRDRAERPRLLGARAVLRIRLRLRVLPSVLPTGREKEGLAQHRSFESGILDVRPDLLIDQLPRRDRSPDPLVPISQQAGQVI